LNKKDTNINKIFKTRLLTNSNYSKGNSNKIKGRSHNNKNLKERSLISNLKTSHNLNKNQLWDKVNKWVKPRNLNRVTNKSLWTHKHPNHRFKPLSSSLLFISIHQNNLRKNHMLLISLLRWGLKMEHRIKKYSLNSMSEMILLKE